MEEDLELREMIKKALETKGVLAQLRATLRAAVFTCVDEHERASGVYVPNPAALAVKHDDEGRLALQVVIDFLRHFDLHQTLSILMMESDLRDVDVLSREELVKVAVSRNGREDGVNLDREAPIVIQLLGDCHAPRNTDTYTEPGQPGLAQAKQRDIPRERASSTTSQPSSTVGPLRRLPAGEPLDVRPDREPSGGEEDDLRSGDKAVLPVAGAGIMPAAITVRKRRGDGSSGGGFPYHAADEHGASCRQQAQEEEEEEKGGVNDRRRQSNEQTDTIERTRTGQTGGSYRQGGNGWNAKHNGSRGGDDSGGLVRDGTMDDNSYDYMETPQAECSRPPGNGASLRETELEAVDDGDRLRWGLAGVTLITAGGKRSHHDRDHDDEYGGGNDDDVGDGVHMRQRPFLEPVEFAGATTIVERLEGEEGYDYVEVAESPHAMMVLKPPSPAERDDHRMMSSIGLSPHGGGFGDGSLDGFDDEDAAANISSERDGLLSPGESEKELGRESYVAGDRSSARSSETPMDDQPNRLGGSAASGVHGPELGLRDGVRAARESDSCEDDDEEDDEQQYYEDDDFDDDDEELEGIHGDGGGQHSRAVEEGRGQYDDRMANGDFDEIEEAISPGEQNRLYDDDVYDSPFAPRGSEKANASAEQYSNAARAHDNVNNSGSEELQWELRVNLSADSSVSVREERGGEGGMLDEEGYHMEDARSP